MSTPESFPLEPIPPERRDPKLVVIGLPAIGEGNWELVRNICSLELQPNPLGLKFRALRCQEKGIGAARNIIVRAARCLGASSVVMIDRDIPATAEHVLRIMGHKEPFVAPLVPARETPLHWLGEFYAPSTEDLRPDGLRPMMSAASCFLRVDMIVFDKIQAAHPELRYLFDEDRPGDQFLHWQAELWDFFGMGVKESIWFPRKAGEEPSRWPRYVTEDYMLSLLWRDLGGECWSDSLCQVGHLGTVDFLDLEAKIQNRVDSSLVQYKKDLEGVGVKVPLLWRGPDGNVSIAKTGKVSR